MQFRVPQFLDIEDKVFGPFTFKQFGYLLGAIAFAYIFWKLIPTVIISFPLIIIFSGTFLALAFVKINNRPFADVLESAYKFVIGDKVFVWHKEQIKKDIFETQRQQNLVKINEIKNKEAAQTKIVAPDKIRELSERLDILKNNNNSNTVDHNNLKEKNINLREQLMRSRA